MLLGTKWRLGWCCNVLNQNAFVLVLVLVYVNYMLAIFMVLGQLSNTGKRLSLSDRLSQMSFNQTGLWTCS